MSSVTQQVCGRSEGLCDTLSGLTSLICEMGMHWATLQGHHKDSFRGERRYHSRRCSKVTPFWGLPSTPSPRSVSLGGARAVCLAWWVLTSGKHSFAGTYWLLDSGTPRICPPSSISRQLTAGIPQPGWRGGEDGGVQAVGRTAACPESCQGEVWPASPPSGQSPC